MSNFLRKNSPNLFLIVIVVLTITNCVPIRKQIVFRDKNKKTLRQIQSMDTVVSVAPFEYRIRKGDVLGIDISTLTPSQYSLDKAAQSGGEVGNSGYLVNDSGYVDIPILGLIKVSDQTLDECRKNIKIIASDYLNNVTVNVKLLNFEVFVIGETRGRLNSPDGKLTLLQALAQIGTPPEFANLKKVKVIRKIEGGSKIHIYYLDVSDIGLIGKPEFYLMPQDVVVFEPLLAKNAKNYRMAIGYLSITISTFFLFYNLQYRFR